MKTLAEQMSFYAAYHGDETNKAIHYLFVPLIVWSAMGLLIQVGTWETAGLGVTVAHLAAAALLLYYLRLDLPLGVAMAFLFTVLLVAALNVSEAAGHRAPWFFAGVFALSWAAQLVGHRFFEGRKPALADDAFQVFVAPVFVMAEWAFAIGLRKELREQVRRGMQAHLPKPPAPPEP